MSGSHFGFQKSSPPSSPRTGVCLICQPFRWDLTGTATGRDGYQTELINVSLIMRDGIGFLGQATVAKITYDWMLSEERWDLAQAVGSGTKEGCGYLGKKKGFLHPWVERDMRVMMVLREDELVHCSTWRSDGPE